MQFCGVGEDVGTCVLVVVVDPSAEALPLGVWTASRFLCSAPVLVDIVQGIGPYMSLKVGTVQAVG